jgi:hypothetical protein
MTSEERVYKFKEAQILLERNVQKLTIKSVKDVYNASLSAFDKENKNDDGSFNRQLMGILLSIN